MTCISKTRAAMNTMTPGEKKLAHLILTDPKQVVDGSAKSIGESCGASAATVVRFAKSLGFESLKEMKADLRSDIAQETAEQEVIEPNSDANLEEMAPHLCRQIASGMYTTLGMQSYPDIEKAVQMLLDAHTVYLYGIGASSLPALDLMQKLVRFNKRAVYREDQDIGYLDANYMTENDLMVVFSYSGTKERVNKAVRIASSRGMKSIAVTRFGRSPLANMATLVLPLPENEQIVRYAAVQSKYASLLMVDLLFAAYVQHLGDGVDEMYKQTHAVIRSE